MSITCLGPLLSSLFYEHASADNDQEGFLLGQIISHVTDTISDSQINNRKEETITYVHSYIPCMPSFSWYDSSGDVDMDSVNTVLAEHKKDVVGWYRSRRNSSLRISLRERNVHKRLAAEFPGVPPSHFLLLLHTPYTAPNLATHTYDHCVLTYNGTFQAKSLQVRNLKDTSQAEYSCRSHRSTSTSQGAYATSIAKVSSQFVDHAGRLQSVVSMQCMSSGLQNQLKELCDRVRLSESELAILAAEVDSLQEHLTPPPPPPAPILAPPPAAPVLAPPPRLIAAPFQTSTTSQSAFFARRSLPTTDLPMSSTPSPTPDQLLNQTAPCDVVVHQKVPSPDLIKWDEHHPLRAAVPDAAAAHRPPAVDLLGPHEPMDTFDPLPAKPSTNPADQKSVELLKGINLISPQEGESAAWPVESEGAFKDPISTEEKKKYTVFAEVTKDSRDIPRKDSRDLRSRTLPRGSTAEIAPTAKHAQSWDAEDVMRLQAKLRMSPRVIAAEIPPPARPAPSWDADDVKRVQAKLRMSPRGSAAVIPPTTKSAPVWDTVDNRRVQAKLERSNSLNAPHSPTDTITTPPQPRRTSRNRPVESVAAPLGVSPQAPQQENINKVQLNFERPEIIGTNPDAAGAGLTSPQTRRTARRIGARQGPNRLAHTTTDNTTKPPTPATQLDKVDFDSSDEEQEMDYNKSASPTF